MAKISRTTASLRFFGDDLVPDEITRLLGGRPTDGTRKGDPNGRVRRSDGIPMRANTGSWLRKVPGQEPSDLELQIRNLLLDLTDDLAIWQKLSSRYAGNVFVGFFMTQVNEGCSLSPHTLRLLTDRGLALDLDVYAVLGDEEDAPAGL